MSMCGGLDQGGPTDEEFDRNVVKYSEVSDSRAVVLVINHSIEHRNTGSKFSQSFCFSTQFCCRQKDKLK